MIRMETNTDLHVSKASGSVNNKQFPNEVSICRKETKKKMHLDTDPSKDGMSTAVKSAHHSTH